MTNPSGKSGHWRVRYEEAKKWKADVAAITMGKRPPKPLKRARLILTRFSSRSPDPDGCVSGFKAIIDGLVQCGILENDRYENIGMPHYLWKKCPKEQGRIRVEVVESRETHEDDESRALSEQEMK
jgi:hypothetical protein